MARNVMIARKVMIVVGSALISLAYLFQMRLLRKDYVRSKPNGKFMSAVCYAMNSFSYRKAQVIHSFSTD